MELQSMTRRRKQTTAAGETGEDGDFVQLRIVRERRLKEKEAKKASNSERKFITKTDDGAVAIEHAPMLKDQPRSRPTTAARQRAAQDLQQQMFAAVDAGDKHMLQSLMAKVSKTETIANIRDAETDQNILHYALAQDKTDIAKALISNGNDDLLLSHHDVLRSGIHGRNNSLHIITEKQDTEMAKFLLNKASTKEKKLELLKRETAVDIKGQRPRLFSCLHLAAYYGFSDLVRLYLESGMDVNHVNGKKDTALLWASRWGHNNAVSLLLDHGADPNVENDKGSTALYWAVRYEFPKTVSLLIQKGKANPNTKRKLGLVAPIVVASAYGNTEVLYVLLQHPDIDINIRIRGGEMPIHHAAREGCEEVVEMLVKRGVLFDEQDEIGDTPMLLAAKSGNVDIVYELIQKGANVNHRNHEGHDAWYFAIENDENDLLQTLVIASRGQETAWRQPLCIAASNGRSDKVQFLLKMNLDPMGSDLDGNTFLHHAAMTDKYEIINKFHSTISINTQNIKGNTPLHVACFRGYTKTIESLLACKANADIKNTKGETPLHVAAYSKHISAETAKTLIEYTIKTHSWESLNAKDYLGNNSLHIAGKFAKPEVLWEFRFVRFKDRDQDGLTPLHEAVRPGEPEALDMMLDIFESMKRDARINEQSYATSETVLHLAADEGHAYCVKRLIELGADISIKDADGNTVLHRLTRACVLDPRNLSRHLEVFDTIFENIVRWLCIKKNVPFPEEENLDDYMLLKREASLFVINNICNGDGLSVMDEGFKSGSPEIIQRILMMPGVTMFEEDANSGIYKFDITGITQRTNNTIQGCCGSQRVAPLTEKDIQQASLSDDYDTRLSGLEWLLTQTAKSRAAEILDLPPIRMIEQYYTSMVARTFAFLMLFHIVYMSILTYVGVDLLAKLRDDESAINSSDPETILLYVVAPLEPAIILIYVVYTVFRYCITGDIGRRSRLSRKRGFKRVLSVVGSYIFIIVCVLFAALVFVWIGLFVGRYEYQDYFLAAAICIGWLLTISFTRGIRLIHYFYRMLISMIIRDISRFLIVYVFIIMAFAFAFHVLFQVSSSVASNYATPGDTLFLTFNMMIGMGELFDDALETGMSSVGRTTTYMKVIYLFYMILGTIVLLNLLIAMMNDSYSMILQENQVTWRIESVSLGVQIESNFPASQNISNVTFINGELGPPINKIPAVRWYVSMTEAEFQQYMREINRKYHSAKDAVTKRLEELEARSVQMEKQTSQKLQHITDMLEQLVRK